MKIVWLMTAFCMSAAVGAGPVIRADADRVKTPLCLDLPRLGTLRPRAAHEIAASNWTLGCEVLDRDFADFDEYKDYIDPLGIKTIRLQGGWAKCEREKGKYDFSWLDHQVDFAVSKGLNVLLETDYGNPVYRGGGGWDLAGGFPTSEEGLAGWDAWVDALTKHFKGRVRDWAMWNEPDIGHPVKTPEQIAAFNVRTAKIVRRNIPDSRIAGLSLANSDSVFFEKCLKAMNGDVDLFDWFIYHGYEVAPEDSYPGVERLKNVLAKYSKKAKMRQGENGCPSEMAVVFALSGVPWSEFSQAKWDLRRMLGDLGHDVESSVFTICDFNHKGKEINLKGLLRADEEKRVIAIKRAYYAVQNAVSVFDCQWTRVPEATFRTSDKTIVTYEYRHRAGFPLYLFWQHADKTRKILLPNSEGVVLPGARTVEGIPVRPGESFVVRLHTFKVVGKKGMEEPVFVDLLTGNVYGFPSGNVHVSETCTRICDVPVYDSPCLITERNAIEMISFNTKGKGENR